MMLFFLVVGLEARRELDLGDLRERRRFALPCVAAYVTETSSGSRGGGRHPCRASRSRSLRMSQAIASAPNALATMTTAILAAW
jgi:hypothetical protein